MLATAIRANVSAYSINRSTGVLTPLAGSPFAVSGAPQGMTVDAGGKALYVASAGSDKVSAFAIELQLAR